MIEHRWAPHSDLHHIPKPDMVGIVEPQHHSVCVGLAPPWRTSHTLSPAHKMPVGPVSIVSATTCPLVPSMCLGDPLQTHSCCEPPSPRQVRGDTPVRIVEPLSSGQQSPSHGGMAFCGPLSALCQHLDCEARRPKAWSQRPDIHSALWPHTLAKNL